MSSKTWTSSDTMFKQYSLWFSKEGRSGVGGNFIKEVVLPSMSNFRHFCP
jgi:hypothetical protein